MTLFTSSSSKSTLPKSGSDSHSDPPPRYSEAVGSRHHHHSSSSSKDFGGFVPTATLQVQAIGYDVDQALAGRTLENISVFRSGSRDAEYVSIRLKENSNSCALVRVYDQATLMSTIYRFGPGRHPRMRILNPHSKVSIEDAIKNENVRGELIEVKSRSMISRAQVFDTSLGKFEWRYGTNADNLLVMERIDRVSLPGGGQSKSGARVAQLIRNDQYRTPGTKKYSGGNGGRLFIDLRMWNEDKHTSPQRVEAFVVASCILMLKREADRFIDNHLALVV
ncbi:hypothetical protein Aspvir_009169 [Aspergillus viridinutans]|uniref:Uncharacterized protein n=1 Tax=Aspergillus viridinutans TaxID=75553 RepID=A0A9P3BZE0_ASPVI|nr:uncharacterized protein Aspvir_009169 [Aspergillus viridinutans]GIK05070.1 hypothetical protein Aspvir_009169 [Aspergillus viridinutans]